MSKILFNNKFKYQDDKLYKIDKRNKKWRCLNNNIPDKEGYILVKVDERRYLLHRLIYLYHNPDWDIHDISKDNEIDHIDINPINNTIENLRIIDCSGNNRNREKGKNCSSIYRGVCWNKKAKKWKASIRIEGKIKHLGYFDDENEAGAMYLSVYQDIMDKY